MKRAWYILPPPNMAPTNYRTLTKTTATAYRIRKSQAKSARRNIKDAAKEAHHSVVWVLPLARVASDRIHHEHFPLSQDSPHHWMRSSRP